LRVVRLAVLASGSGTLLDAILDAGLPVVTSIVDRPCRAQEVAGSHGVESVLIERPEYGPTFDRDGYTKLVVAALESREVELVVMAGFGTVLGQPAFDAFPGRILNTHPALLPAFKGWHAVQAALDAGVRVTGCTVHVATLEVDDGPILAQEAVPVLDGDDEASLHERIKEVERRLYIDTIAAVVERPELLTGRAGAARTR
jgi:phosphoribosylglycinamide formyltransferase-1